MKILLIICLLGALLAVWWLYKPVRVLAPGLVDGVTCVDELLCLDDATRRDEARALYEAAVAYVNAAAGAIEQPPRAVFCATEACFRAFGFVKSTARTIGVSGIVISPRGWDRYYLRHELIHHLQAERLGVLRQMFAPDWFTEGMAYSLSGVPGELGEPWQSHRARFERWHEGVGRGALWSAAREL